MRKKIVALASLVILIIVMTIIVMCFKTESIVKKTERLQVIATLFPQYDFAKQIGGDKIDVKLLLKSAPHRQGAWPRRRDRECGIYSRHRIGIPAGKKAINVLVSN